MYYTGLFVELPAAFIPMMEKGTNKYQSLLKVLNKSLEEIFNLITKRRQCLFP